MRAVKVLFSSVLLLLLVGAVALISLLIFVDPNKLKPVLIEEVKKQSNYQLAIDGNLNWSFYPRIGVKIDHLLLQAPNQPQAFLELRDVTVATPVSQLWKGREKLSGIVYVADIVVMNLHLERVTANLHWVNNKLTVQDIKASLYAGTAQGVAHSQNVAGVPHFDWDLYFKNVQLKPLLDDLNGTDSKIKVSGSGDIHFTATAEGKTQDQIIHSMLGSADYRITTGVLQGVDLNYYLQTADALIHKQPITSFINTQQTVFDTMNGSLEVKDAQLSTNDLQLTSLAFLAHADGNVGLLSRELNLQVKVKSQQNLQSQWQVPILITGTLSHPDVRLDTHSVESLVPKEKLDKLKTKAKDEIEKHVHGKAGEFLQNLIR